MASCTAGFQACCAAGIHTCAVFCGHAPPSHAAERRGYNGSGNGMAGGASRSCSRILHGREHQADALVKGATTAETANVNVNGAASRARSYSGVRYPRALLFCPFRQNPPIRAHPCESVAKFVGSGQPTARRGTADGGKHPSISCLSCLSWLHSFSRIRGIGSPWRVTAFAVLHLALPSGSVSCLSWLHALTPVRLGLRLSGCRRSAPAETETPLSRPRRNRPPCRSRRTATGRA